MGEASVHARLIWTYCRETTEVNGLAFRKRDLVRRPLQFTGSTNVTQLVEALRCLSCARFAVIQNPFWRVWF